MYTGRGEWGEATPLLEEAEGALEAAFGQEYEALGEAQYYLALAELGQATEVSLADYNDSLIEVLTHPIHSFLRAMSDILESYKIHRYIYIHAYGVEELNIAMRIPWRPFSGGFLSLLPFLRSVWNHQRLGVRAGAAWSSKVRDHCPGPVKMHS